MVVEIAAITAEFSSIVKVVIVAKVRVTSIFSVTVFGFAATLASVVQFVKFIFPSRMQEVGNEEFQVQKLSI